MRAPYFHRIAYAPSRLSYLMTFSALLMTITNCGATPDRCGAGTHTTSKICEPDVMCGPGTHAVDSVCVPDHPEIVCAAGTHKQNDMCIPDYARVRCGPGTVEQNGRCVLEDPVRTCGLGTVLRGTTCVNLSIQHIPMPFQIGYATRSVQTFHGIFSHNGAAVYAVDFVAAPGTPVAAVRGGRVQALRLDSNMGCATSSCARDANYLIIDHGDGTVARYWHLQQNGVLVGLGDTVCQGQKVALTGNTGWSTGPHLHIEVDDLLEQSLPLRFREIPGEVPFAGTFFTSANSTPTACMEQYSFSECPKDIFSFMGIALDPTMPCGFAKRDYTYMLVGTSVSDAPNVMMAIKNPSNEWIRSCVAVQAGGRFSHRLRFSSAAFQDQAFLMVAAANDTCTAAQGWNSSVRLYLTP